MKGARRHGRRGRVIRRYSPVLSGYGQRWFRHVCDDQLYSGPGSCFGKRIPITGGEATNVDKFIIKIQPDANTQMMTLSGGDIDVAMNMTDDTMSELEGAENISIINGATIKTVGFA